MTKKTILCLKTGLFEEDPVLEKASGADQTFELPNLTVDEDWDAVIEAVLDHDLVISL